jgi:sugar/nucleoside kinase (ribokinase family)
MFRGQAITALVLGAVTRDESRSASGEKQLEAGGVPTYAGTALARLGAHVRVVTRLHERDGDALLAPLLAEGVEVHALPSAMTTTYALDYSGASDVHELRATSDPIGPDDLPESWRRADLIQLGPLHRRDLLPALVEDLAGFTGLDVQGLVREPHGKRDLPRLLPQVDVLQVSEEESGALLEGEPLEAFAKRFGLGEVLITRGALGATLLTAGTRYEVRAAPSTGRHRIGAGDVFLACYLLQRVRGAAPERAAEWAARVCAEKLDAGQVPKGFDPDLPA